MDQTEVLKIFLDTDALLDGHFLLSSGLHSGKYLQCARILERPQVSEKLCRLLLEHLQGETLTAVIGPAMGGIILAYELARVAGARALFAERDAAKMCLRRGFSLSAQDRALVAEDVITTGGSVKEVIELVKNQGAQIAAVCALVDRSQGRIDFGLACVSLLKLEIQNYSPESCPLCQQDIPLVKPGSRKI